MRGPRRPAGSHQPRTESANGANLRPGCAGRGLRALASRFFSFAARRRRPSRPDVASISLAAAAGLGHGIERFLSAFN